MKDILDFAAFVIHPEACFRYLRRGKAVMSLVGHEPLEYIAKCSTHATFVSDEFSFFSKPFYDGDSIYAFGSNQESALAQLRKFLEQEKQKLSSQLEEVDREIETLDNMPNNSENEAVSE